MSHSPCVVLKIYSIFSNGQLGGQVDIANSTHSYTIDICFWPQANYNFGIPASINSSANCLISSNDYSCLSASMGSSLAARRAGK